MPDFSGLGAAPGGWLGAMETGADLEQRRLQAQRTRQVIEGGQIDLAARAGADRTIQALSGGPQHPQQQPGQAPQPAQRGPQISGKPNVGAAATQPQSVGQQTPQMQGGGPGAPLPQGATSPQPMQQRPQEGGKRGSELGTTGGPLTARELIAAAVRANPGAPPGVIAGVVENLLPLVKTDEAAFARQEALRLKQDALTEKQREFNVKIIETRTLADQKLARIDEKLANERERIGVGKTSNEIKMLEHERKQVKDESDSTIRMLNAQLRQYGIETKAETAREGFETRKEIAGGQQQTQRDVAETRAGAAKDVAEIRGAAGVAREKEKGAQTRETGEARHGQKMEEIELSGSLKQKLQDAASDVKIDIEQMRQHGKLEQQEASQAFKGFWNGLNLKEKREAREYVEGKKDERAEAGREARSADKTADREARERAEAAKQARWEQDNILRQQKFAAQRERLTPSLQNNLKRAEGAGFDTDAIKQQAEFYATTGDYSPRVKGLDRFTKTAVIAAIDKYTKEEMRLTPEQLILNKQTFAAQNTQIKKLTDPTSQTGQVIRSLSVVQEHLRTVKSLADAWNPSDNRAFNQIAAWASRQFGGTAATNLDSAAHIVGTEIIKAMGVRGAGTQQERDQAAALFGASAKEAHGLINMAWNMAHGVGGATLEQLYGNINTMQELLNGQLKGVRAQAFLVPEPIWNAMLTEAARDEMERIKEGRPSLQPQHQFPGFGMGGFNLTPGRKPSQEKPTYGGPQQ